MTVVVRTRSPIDPPLAELIRVVGGAAPEYEWTPARVEGEGPSALWEMFSGWAERGLWVAAREVQRVADGGVELHAGEMRGRLAGGKAPAVVLRARRYEGWDVETANSRVLEAVKAAYPESTAIAGGGLRVPPGPNVFRPR